MKKNKYSLDYPNLLTNGKIFPAWVQKYFKEYTLEDPSYSLDSDVKDGCQTHVKTKKEFRKYQEFLTRYLSFDSPYDSILLYHGLGSGKTATVIGIYNNLFNANNGNWNVIIILKAILKTATWDGPRNELDMWLDHREKERRYSNIYFISYDSPTADKQFMDLINRLDKNKKNLFIVDEAHNFIRNVYSNKQTQKGKRAQVIYDYIRDEKENNPRKTRIILISATPIINVVYELALIYDLLRPGIFNLSESEFNHLFIKNDQISNDTVNMFQRRILGLTSFYESIDPTTYATTTTYYINVEMSKYQWETYTYFDNLEKQFENAHPGHDNSLYKTYTRQSSNFVFPNIHDISGEKRPRPFDFHISEKEAIDIIRAKQTSKSEVSDKILIRRESYEKALKNYIQTFNQTVLELLHKMELYESLEDEFKIILRKADKIAKIEPNLSAIERLNKAMVKHYNKPKKCSQLFQLLYDCSSKYVLLCLNIMTSPGPVLIYTNYVLMEGIDVISIYFNALGYSAYNHKKPENGTDYKRYCEYSGRINKDILTVYKSEYNKAINKEGKTIKIIMISPAGTEGLSLLSVRQIHIMEPHWNEVRIKQMIGRGVRLCSHKYLPIIDRKVDIFRYLAVSKHATSPTTDELIQNLAMKKEKIHQSFLDAIKQASVDCELNFNVNKLKNPDLKCFHFNENAELIKQSTGAYTNDFDLDYKGSSGFRSTNSKEIPTELIEITAINSKNKKKKYWLNRISNIVYYYGKQVYPVGVLQTINKTNIPKTYYDNGELIFYLKPDN